MSGEESPHQPVMVCEVLDFLKTAGGGAFADCTLGMGGHSGKILSSSPDAIVVGLDCDSFAVAAAVERLNGFGQRFRAFCENYINLDSVLKALGLDAVEGILLDLGLSSAQLKDETRGFSFMKSAPLDMRMDMSLGIKAEDLVNGLAEKELSGIFSEFGQEHRAKRIAAAIVRARKQVPIRTTGDLSEIIDKVYGKRGRINPSTKVFQALRISVNKELESLEDFLDKSVSMLSPGGRLCVISYHSLEDRIVKNKFRAFKESGSGAIILKKPLVPSREEVLSNRRSRSAKLRVLERVKS